jgi:hypothetical protein
MEHGKLEQGQSLQHSTWRAYRNKMDRTESIERKHANVLAATFHCLQAAVHKGCSVSRPHSLTQLNTFLYATIHQCNCVVCNHRWVGSEGWAERLTEGLHSAGP